MGNNPRGPPHLERGKRIERAGRLSYQVRGEGHFVDCIDTGKTPITVAVQETKYLKVVLSVHESAERGKTVKIDELGAWRHER